ncbi:AAA family ATPase [Methanobrevibacter sp.]|uniref:AAA family ATPase n=1 Tax=Methanobrevibacter sp. TaxID=66852 RepID=UPI002E78A2F4|nr:AAA family ATPase [Methanobrevibacter sp.]MEE0940131.1 AAA family ATPase [Methanobrevibacter sp.]
MIIESIKIENFRQYKGPIDLKFSLDKNKNFTIIRGTNGAGKTNLLNAITWCLYDDELHKPDKVSGGPIYNLITKNKMGPNDEFYVKVELSMLDEYENRVIFRRSLKCYTDKNNVFVEDPFGSKFDVFYSDGVNDKPLSNPYIFIEKNMPKDIEGYFFFDGEKLEDYFEENSGSSISKSVSELSQLNLLDLVSSRLSTRKLDYYNQIRKLNKDESEVVGSKNEFESKKRKASKDKNDAIAELEIIDGKLKALHKEKEQVDHTDAKTLERDLSRLKNREANLDNSINKGKNKKNEYLINSFPLLLSYSAMKYSCELGEDLEEAGFIPPQYKKGFLDSILDKNECICGCDLSQDIDARSKIVNLKNNTSELTDVSEEVNVTLRDLKDTMISVQKFNEVRDDFNDQIRKDKHDLSEIQSQIEEKELQYNQINHPLIRKLEQDIKDFNKKRDEQIEKRVNAERDYRDAVDELDKIEREERGRRVKDKQIISLKKYNSFCESAIDILETLKNDLTNSIRNKVQKATEEQFKKLMWKDNFKSISITKSYNVLLKDVTGETVTPGILSAGEKLVLALSFVAALNTISGFELPFIIDTPMGRLDQEMKTNISKTLPEYVKGNQVALLVTGEEYTDSFREGIIDNVGKEYMIEVNETDIGTESKIILNE